MKLPHAIETLSGRMFDFDRPQPDQVVVTDIATALANTCRFGGHVKEYYSVAEHALLVYRLVRRAGFSPAICYAALHHDSHEAYAGDVPTPLKRKINKRRRWSKLVAPIDTAICDQLGISHQAMEHEAIRWADSLALSYEAALLKPSGRAQRHGTWLQLAPADVPTWAVACMAPKQAALEFLLTHWHAQHAAWGF